MIRLLLLILWLTMNLLTFIHGRPVAWWGDAVIFGNMPVMLYCIYYIYAYGMMFDPIEEHELESILSNLDEKTL